LALIAASERTDLEIEQLLKAQAQLASDVTITDQKTFNEKYNHLSTLMRQKRKEQDEQFAEGSRLIRTP
jgi:hypothetical protein